MRQNEDAIQEALAEKTNARGSSNCPICWKDTPHAHSKKEVEEYNCETYQEGVLRLCENKKLKEEQRQRRLKQQVKHSGERAIEITQLKARIKMLENFEVDNPCEFCRDLPYGGYELKYDCDELYGLVINRRRKAAYCPECGKCMASWEN